MTGLPELDQDACGLRDDIVALARRLRQSAPPGGESWTALMALGAIERSEGQAIPSRIGAELDLRSSNLAHLLGDLAQRGLVQRTPDPADKRKMRLSITAAGADVVREARAKRDGWLIEAMRACLSPDEQAQLIAAGPLMRRLALSSQGLPPGAPHATRVPNQPKEA